MIIRSLSIMTGMLILAATAHVTVLAIGGYSADQAPLIIAVAIGVGVGALAVGLVWFERRWILAAIITLAMICGEGFGLLQTGERLIAAREAAQTPLREATAARAAALSAVSDARAAIARQGSSPRLGAALVVKLAADKAVIEKAALRGCRKNCRQLLQKQVDGAATEVSAARSAMQRKQDAVSQRLIDAKLALAAIKLPASTSGLAARLGVPAWTVDILIAALGSIGANGLGCGLLAAGAHRPRRMAVVELRATDVSAGEDFTAKINAPPVTVDVDKQVARFGIECLSPGEDAVQLEALRSAYVDWCGSRKFEPAGLHDFAAALGELLNNAGIKVKQSQGKTYVLGVVIDTHSRALAVTQKG